MKTSLVCYYKFKVFMKNSHYLKVKWKVISKFVVELKLSSSI